MTSRNNAAESAVVFYEDLAPYFDRLTEYNDPKQWVDVFEELARRHGLAAHRVVDLATGTGKCAFEFAQRGYSVHGVDISPAMITCARAKTTDALPVTFEVADICTFTSDPEFNLATCASEGLNYLLSEDDLQAAVNSVSRCLMPNGLFVFDVNTVLAYQTEFAETAFIDRGDLVFVWKGEASKDFQPEGLACLELECFSRIDDGNWSRLTIRHTQKHYAMSTIVSALEGADFSLEGIYAIGEDGSFNLVENEGRYRKILYVAKRP